MLSPHPRCSLAPHRPCPAIHTTEISRVRAAATRSQPASLVAARRCRDPGRSRFVRSLCEPGVLSTGRVRFAYSRVVFVTLTETGGPNAFVSRRMAQTFHSPALETLNRMLLALPIRPKATHFSGSSPLHAAHPLSSRWELNKCLLARLLCTIRSLECSP